MNLRLSLSLVALTLFHTPTQAAAQASVTAQVAAPQPVTTALHLRITWPPVGWGGGRR